MFRVYITQVVYSQLNNMEGNKNFITYALRHFMVAAYRDGKIGYDTDATRLFRIHVNKY